MDPRPKLLPRLILPCSSSKPPIYSPQTNYDFTDRFPPDQLRLQDHLQRKPVPPERAGGLVFVAGGFRCVPKLTPLDRRGGLEIMGLGIGDDAPV